MSADAMNEIRAVMAFYNERGWDWTVVVAHLASTGCGAWPLAKGWVFKRPKADMYAQMKRRSPR